MEARLPNAPLEMFGSDTGPAITDIQMEKHLANLSMNFVAASIAFRQAQIALGRGLAQTERRKAARRRLENGRLPVNLLPRELLSEIFRFIPDPFVVGAVCHHWRQVSISAPGLWSYITGDLGSFRSHRVRLALHRSKCHSLSFHRIHIENAVEAQDFAGLLQRTKFLDSKMGEAPFCPFLSHNHQPFTYPREFQPIRRRYFRYPR